MVDQNKLVNVKYLIYVAWQQVMQDPGYTWNQIQDCHGNCSIQQENSFRQQIRLKFREETNELLQLGHSFVWCWNLDTSGNRSEIIWKFCNVVLEAEGKDQSDRSTRNEKVLYRVKEDLILVYTI